VSRGPDAATLLERAIVAHAAAAGVTVRIVIATATRWASATFSGARHALMLEGGWTAAATAWLGQLDEAELPIRGHLVADLAVLRTEHAGDRFSATVYVLTLEER